MSLGREAHLGGHHSDGWRGPSEKAWAGVIWGSSAGLCGVRRPAELASSAPPMWLANSLPKAVNVESAKVPSRDPRPPNAHSGPDGLSFPSKLQHGFIPKQNNNKSRTLVCAWLTSVKHHDH